uniref:DUF2326 domain-containing protein n=1 Tax=Strongyloides venezuelensis TaxID=75913 RepID=A0A0K0FNQ2_STRVS
MKFKNDNCYLNDNGAIKSYMTKKEVKFKVGNQIIKCHAYLCDINFSKRSYDGILGWNIFKQLIVFFDEKNDNIVFHNVDEKSVEINVSIIDEVEKTHFEVQRLKKEFHDIITKNEFDFGSGKIKCKSIVLKNGCEFPKPATIPVQRLINRS